MKSEAMPRMCSYPDGEGRVNSESRSGMVRVWGGKE